jgi:hypothetical protein
MKQPIAKFRAGSVSAALWKNETNMNRKTVLVLRATVERRYQDGNSNWKSSGSFSRNEIPLAIFCLEKAFEKMICEQPEDVVPEEVVR